MVRSLFKRNKTQDTSVTLTMGSDTAMLHSFDGPMEDELPPRCKAVELSGKPGERSIDTMAECRACALHFASEILNGSMGLTMPIAQSQIKKLGLVKDVLVYLADECGRQRANGSKRSKGKMSAEAWAEWELELLDATFMIQSKAFLKPDAGFWARVHKLTAPAVHARAKAGPAHQRFFMRKTEKNLSFIGEYKALVLCGLANPQQLSEGDLLRVRIVAAMVSDDVTLITPKQRFRGKTGKRVRFRIDPNVDAPAKAFSEKADEKVAPEGEEVFVDTSKAIIRLGNALKAIKNGDRPPLPGLEKVNGKTLRVIINHLLIAWGKKQVRRSERMRSGLDVNVIIGVDRTHQFISEVQDIYQRDDFTNRDRMEHVGQMTEDSNKAEIIDESETGLRLRVRALGVRARAGDLVCVMTRYANHYTYIPGEIRWVENQSANEFDIGILKLGKQMAAVHVLPDDYVDEFEEQIPAFIARSMQEDDKHWRLIAPAQRLQDTHEYLFDARGSRHLLSNLQSVTDTKQIDGFRCKLSTHQMPAGEPPRAAPVKVEEIAAESPGDFDDDFDMQDSDDSAYDSDFDDLEAELNDISFN